jgi:hypothetical protein
MDVYPTNKTSSFKIQLNEPIDIGAEEWEVALMSINYPYTWTNVGEAAQVYMKYYIDTSAEVKEIHFPNWQCKSMSEVIAFINNKITDIAPDAHNSNKIFFGQDELGRVKIYTEASGFDIGFSPNMLRLLGLAGHRKADVMQMSSFEKRQDHRDFLNLFWSRENPFDFDDEQLCSLLNNTSDFLEVIEVIRPFLDKNKVLFTQNIPMVSYTHPWQGQGTMHRKEIESWYEGFQNSGTYHIEWALEEIVYHMKMLVSHSEMPKKIKGVTPGIINPVQRMYIYANFIEPIDFNNKPIRLLKMVNTRGEAFKTVQEEFENPIYVPVEKGKISRVEVLIGDDSGGPVSFQSGTVVLTLHFRKAIKRRKYF